MPLETIYVPDSIRQLQHSARATELIDDANERIEAFLLASDFANENFVTCDFHLLDQSLNWIVHEHLLTGNRFCELGSGFGVAAMLASIQSMESIGIEVEQELVDQASDLAESWALSARFYCGSFVPSELIGRLESSPELNHVALHEGDVYGEIGLELDDFDLFFAFPWPDEQPFFDELFLAAAADGALLLTYHGREGMRLSRKT